MCQAPAKLAGLSHRKGKITPGYDADFVVWSQDKTYLVGEKGIQHKNKITPYLGREMKGLVLATILAGKIIYTNEEGFIGSPQGTLHVKI